MQVKAVCQYWVLTASQVQVVQHSSVTIGQSAAGPIPFLEWSVNRFITLVAVQIAMALPGLIWVLQLNIHARAGRNGPPGVFASGFEVDTEVEQLLGVNAHTSFDAPGQWHTDFVDVNAQGLPIPMQLTWPNVECVGASGAMRGASLGHGPTVGLAAVKRDIQTAKIFWICG